MKKKGDRESTDRQRWEARGDELLVKNSRQSRHTAVARTRSAPRWPSTARTTSTGISGSPPPKKLPSSHTQYASSSRTAPLRSIVLAVNGKWGIKMKMEVKKKVALKVLGQPIVMWACSAAPAGTLMQGQEGSHTAVSVRCEL
jgi:hypothetical protein